MADARCQHNAFECAAAAKGYVSLAVCKGTRGVNHHMVESKPLALVNGDGPCQFYGVLFKSAVYFLFYFLSLFVKDVACVFPNVFVYLDKLFGVGFGTYCKTVVAYFDNLTNHAIKVALVCVILYKHYLCTAFEGQIQVGGIGVFRKIAFNGGIVCVGLCIKHLHFMRVDVVCLVVVGD